MSQEQNAQRQREIRAHGKADTARVAEALAQLYIKQQRRKSSS